MLRKWKLCQNYYEQSTTIERSPFLRPSIRHGKQGVEVFFKVELQNMVMLSWASTWYPSFWTFLGCLIGAKVIGNGL